LRGEHGEFALDDRDFLLVLGTAQRLLSALLRLQRPGFVEIAAADRGVGEHGHQRRLDFQNSAGDEDQIFFAAPGRPDAHRARPDAGYQRSMPRIDAEFARLSGQDHELRLAGED